MLLLIEAETAVEGGWGLRKEDVSVRNEDPRRRLSGVCGNERGMKLFNAFLTANAVHGNVQYCGDSGADGEVIDGELLEGRGRILFMIHFIK